MWTQVVATIYLVGVLAGSSATADFSGNCQPSHGDGTYDLTIAYSVAAAAVVGSGSIVNCMGYNRGSKADNDGWEALGNPGCGWARSFPYFLPRRHNTMEYHLGCVGLRQWPAASAHPHRHLSHLHEPGRQ